MNNWLSKCSNSEVQRTVFTFKLPKTTFASVHGKEHNLKFVNTDSNSDSYKCDIMIKKTDYNVEVRLEIISSILAYPAFEQTWIYDVDKYKKAAKVYNKVVHTIEDIKVDYESEIVPGSTLSAMIREAMRPIDPGHKEITRQLPLEESRLIEGVSDWRGSIYGDRYPAPIIMNVDSQYNYWGNNNEPVGKQYFDHGRKKR